MHRLHVEKEGDIKKTVVFNDNSKVEYIFFQAEDGIRDYKVTGVQTCALPIYPVAGFLTMPRHVSLLCLR